ncbi:CtsR family transcriptional regulator [Weissella halotolerans]|nr:CtsR family transcriptional regulator [Weissella halotolerans]
MTADNMSDCIEQYLKAILTKDKHIEIKRASIAEQFDVVPSQINYVIKTRFTLQRGYLVESKRGGRGYIRIEQVAPGADDAYLRAMVASLGDLTTSSQADEVLDCLMQKGLLTKHEQSLIGALLSTEALTFGNVQKANALRTRLLTQLLNRLRFESERG